MFLISWRSAVPEIGHLTWNDYLNLGPLKATDIVREGRWGRQESCARLLRRRNHFELRLRLLAARGEDKFSTITLLTTMIDFSDTGDIGLLINDGHVVLREATIGNGGILPGKELAFTFGTLRANDLIWRYVVNSYLKGATPDAFDLLYWDSDSVSLPGPMYCWYTRNTYLENKIGSPARPRNAAGHRPLARQGADLSARLARGSHRAVEERLFSKNLIGREPRFVLAASGHVAGVINPPAGNRRSHWLNDDVSGDANAWLDNAEEHPVSWWGDWDAWLKRHSTGTVDAPAAAGQRKLSRRRARARPLCEAEVKLRQFASLKCEAPVYRFRKWMDAIITGS